MLIRIFQKAFSVSIQHLLSSNHVNYSCYINEVLTQHLPQHLQTFHRTKILYVQGIVCFI